MILWSFLGAPKNSCSVRLPVSKPVFLETIGAIEQLLFTAISQSTENSTESYTRIGVDK